MMAAHPQVQALTALYRQPDPGNERAPITANDRGAEQSDLAGGLPRNNTTDAALRRVKGLLPIIVTETRIALDCARDVYLTGGIELEDGRRLRTAYERIKKIAEIVSEAEREVAG